MEFQELIRARYSCRDFDSRPVDRAVLEEILNAGRLAPTAKNYQPYHIYVVESGELLEKIDAVSPCRYNAPVVLVITVNHEEAFKFQDERGDSAIEDGTIVATHLILAAKNAGVESCWVNLFDPAAAKSALNLPENEEILTLMMLGHAGRTAHPAHLHAKRKELSEVVTYL